jgi:hypothetical protein
MEIQSAYDLYRALINGPYAWPGGYPCYFVMQDGEALSFKAARENIGQLLESVTVGKGIRNSEWDQWRPIALEINWEDNNLVCAYTGERIEFAYGED